MKILYVTDLHGHVTKYWKIYDIVTQSGYDMVINGGDMLPKFGNLRDQEKFITSTLDNYFSHFDKINIPYLCMLGNDDLKAFDNIFLKVLDKYQHVHNLAQSMIKLNGFYFVGMNWVQDYPFRLKDRCRKDSENFMFPMQFGTGLLSNATDYDEIPNWHEYAASLPTIEEELDRLPQPKEIRKAIYVIHTPPYRCGLDVCMNGDEVGSKAVYNFIEKKQPLLTLHGHIHESPFKTGRWYRELGETLCIQPGQQRDLSYASIELSDTEIKNYTLENVTL